MRGPLTYKCLWTRKTTQSNCHFIFNTRCVEQRQSAHISKMKSGRASLGYKTTTLLFLLYVFPQQSAVIKSPLIYCTPPLTYRVQLYELVVDHSFIHVFHPGVGSYFISLSPCARVHPEQNQNYVIKCHNQTEKMPIFVGLLFLCFFPCEKN